MDLSTAKSDETVLVTRVDYRVESTGRKVSEPIVELFVRSEDESRRRIDVTGFRPYFYISYDEFLDRPTDVLRDRHVVGIQGDFSPDDFEMDAPDGDSVADVLSANEDCFVDHNPETRTNLDDEKCVKIYTVEPSHVGKIREHFETTYEADIPFSRRFLIDSDIRLGAVVSDGVSEVRYENHTHHSSSDDMIQTIRPPEDEPTFHPRAVTFDIEVETEGGGVPDPGKARNSITAITAYDNYEDVYAGWMLVSPQWDDDVSEQTIIDRVAEQLDVELDTMDVFDHETDMLEDFINWTIDKSPDALYGWNSSGFDVPYLINRAYNVSAYAIRDLAAGEDNPYTKGNEWPDGEIPGIVDFDMLQAYKKTQYTELDSYKLDDVAEAELGHGKIQLGEEFDDAWHNHPVEFLTYNVRDVEAVVEIDRESGLIDLYNNLRRVTGAQYNSCHHNGPMLDTLFLRQGAEEGVALPTNTEPEQGDFHGAHVFNPVPGKHENVVYPDLASLYPYIIWSLNIGPETLYTTKEELRADGYTMDDVFTAYVDKRDWKIVPAGESLDLTQIDEAEYKGVHDESGSRKKTSGFDGIFNPLQDEHPRSRGEIYFLKPEIKEGLVRKVVDDLVDLKYAYKSQKDMYAAVKRVTNSIFGVLGDSNSNRGKGARLFDWHLGEAITLTGQKVIKFTAEQYETKINEIAAEEGYEANAYLVAGDTDSVMTAIPGAPNYETALRWAQEASEYFQPDEEGNPGLYDQYMETEFGVIYGEDEHKMDVEIESLGSSLFYIQDQDADRPEEFGVKKRYAQHMLWDDTDGWLDLPDPDETDYDVLNDPDDRSVLKQMSSVGYDDYESGALSDAGSASDNIGVKGFEYVRSDSATVTREAQLRVLTDILLMDDPIDSISEYLTELDENIRNGDRDPADIGRPKGIGNPLDEYGWKPIEELEADSKYTVTAHDSEWGGRYITTPSPTYRGAKYADDHFPWEDIGAGSKPIRFYVDRVDPTSDYPEVYEYESYPSDGYPESPEIDTEVDAIAVDYPERLPDDFELDVDLMVSKELVDKLNPILKTIGTEWSGVVGEGRQSSMSDWT